MLGDAKPEFERFFRAEYPSMVRTLVPRFGDVGEAEAVAQQAFVTAMTRWTRTRRYDRPGAWVRRVAIERNQATYLHWVERGQAFVVTTHRECVDDTVTSVDELVRFARALEVP